MHFSPLLLTTLSFAYALSTPVPHVKRDDYTTCLNDCIQSYNTCDSASSGPVLSLLSVLQGTSWQVIPMLSLHPMIYPPISRTASNRKQN